MVTDSTDLPTDRIRHAHARAVHLLLLEEHAQEQPSSWSSSALPALAAPLLLLPNPAAAPVLPRAILSLLALLCDPARLRVSASVRLLQIHLRSVCLSCFESPRPTLTIHEHKRATTTLRGPGDCWAACSSTRAP